jgi:hypothetical protein
MFSPAPDIRVQTSVGTILIFDKSLAMSPPGYLMNNCALMYLGYGCPSLLEDTAGF